MEDLINFFKEYSINFIYWVIYVASVLTFFVLFAQWAEVKMFIKKRVEKLFPLIFFVIITFLIMWYWISQNKITLFFKSIIIKGKKYLPKNFNGLIPLIFLGIVSAIFFLLVDSILWLLCSPFKWLYKVVQEFSSSIKYHNTTCITGVVEKIEEIEREENFYPQTIASDETILLVNPVIGMKKISLIRMVNLNGISIVESTLERDTLSALLGLGSLEYKKIICKKHYGKLIFFELG